MPSPFEPSAPILGVPNPAYELGATKAKSLLAAPGLIDAVPAWVSAPPAAFARVSVVAVLAVATNVPLFAALVNPATIKVVPATALAAPPVTVPVYTVFPPAALATWVKVTTLPTNRIPAPPRKPSPSMWTVAVFRVSNPEVFRARMPPVEPFHADPVRAAPKVAVV